MATIRQKVVGAFDKIVAKQPDAIQTGQISRATLSGGGPSNPSGETTSTTLHSTRMAVFEIAERRIDGTNILAGDFQVIVEPLGIEVTLEDKVVCDRGTLVIIQLGRVASGGETALYDMVCRG